MVAGVEGDGGLTNAGSWVSTAAFYVGAGIFALFAVLFGLSLLRSDTLKKQAFSVTSMIIVSIAGLAYLCMAFGYGSTYRSKDQHEVYYARYIDWLLTTPLLLYDACRLAGANSPFTMAIIFCDVLMILLGLFAALSDRNRYLWAYFALGCLALLPILYFLMVYFKGFLNPEVRKAYGTQMTLLAVLWIIYPIAWAIGSDGAGKISVDATTIWFLILDVIAKAMYGGLLLTVHRKSLSFADGDYLDEPAGRRVQPPQRMDPLSPGGRNRIKFAGDGHTHEMQRLKP